jgi:hypothetical protein
MASRWDRLKNWMGSKPTAEELEKARTPSYAEANGLDEKALAESNAFLKDAATASVRASPAGMAYDFMTNDPEAEAELARVRGNAVAGPASPDLDQAALLDAQRRLSTNAVEGPESQAPTKARAKKGSAANDMAKALAAKPVQGPELLEKIQNPVVRDYMAKKFDDRDHDLEAEQKRAQELESVSSFGRIGERIAAGFGDRAADTSGFDALEGKARQGVADTLQRRQAQRQKKADREGDEDRTRALAFEDPGSDQSRIARDLFSQRFPDAAARLGDKLQTLSANTLAKYVPGLEKDVEAAARKTESDTQRQFIAGENAKQRAAARAAAMAKGDNKDDLLYVTGYRRTGPGTIKPETAAKFATAVAANDALQGKLQRLKQMRQEHGQEVGFGQAKAAMDGLAEGIMLDIKDLEEMGALDAGTQAVAKTMIPQSGDFWNADALTKLDTMASNANNKLAAKASALGYERDGNGSQAQPSGYRRVTLKDGRRGLFDPSTSDFKPE